MTGNNLYSLSENNGIINSVCFSPCGNYFCSGSENGNLNVWKNNLIFGKFPEIIENEKNYDIYEKENLEENDLRMMSSNNMIKIQNNEAEINNENNNIYENVNREIGTFSNNLENINEKLADLELKILNLYDYNMNYLITHKEKFQEEIQ